VGVDWLRGHLAGLRLAKREFDVHTSQTGETLKFSSFFTVVPSIEGQKGVNEFSELKAYVAPVDIS
jgi:hypothetical protein